MPRPCNTCRHPELPAINADLVSGTPRIVVARQYGLTETGVRRHYHLHLPAMLRLEADMDLRTAARDLRAVYGLVVANLRRQVETAIRRRNGRAWRRAARLLIDLQWLQRRLQER
jgi:hypothetical protein